MPAKTPIYARERTAAELLDMRPTEFRALVDAGALPGPIRIGNFDRWRVADLEAVATGSAMEEDFEI